MKNLVILGIFVFTLVIINVTGQNSPCPNFFQYQQDGNRKYGIITIPGPGEGKTVINAAIGIHGPIYDSNSGGLKLRKSLESSVNDAKQGRDVQYTFDFPRSEQWPIITKIALNYETICDGSRISNAPTWSYEHSFTYPSGSTHLSVPNKRPQQGPVQSANPFNIFQTPPTPRPTPPPTRPAPPAPTPTPTRTPPRPVSNSEPARPDDPTWLNTFRYKSTCGKRENFTPSEFTLTQLVIGGDPVEIREYPWMVAMYHFQRRKMVYACGATLVTNRHVITAAHCTKGQQRVQLVFGKHDLSEANGPEVLIRITEDITEHPEYFDNQAHADIAIIAFDPVEFSDRIKPICLWQFGTAFDSIKKTGIITGWGQVEQGGDSSEIPNQLKVTRTDIENCRNSNTALRNLATDKTFCAGGENKGPCQGDSGSGFYINQTNTFYLRGIISHSIGSQIACNVDKYAVYADLIYFLDWIRGKIS